MGRAPPSLHVVTDDAVLRRPDFGPSAQRVLARGGEDLALHLRGPETTGAALFRLARELAPAARGSGAVLVVNDRVDVARILELPGVHLGERSIPVDAARRIVGPGVLVGRSVHDPEAAASPEAVGADYLFVGTIFPSASHPGRPGAGPERIRSVADVTDLPVYGIGGIDPDRVAPVLDAGARGVAVLSGVWDADDPPDAVRAYRRALNP